MKQDDLPTQSEVAAALHGILRARPKGITPQEAYDELATQFELSYPQAHRRMNNEDREIHWHNRVRQAHRELITKGIAEAGGSRIWTLSAFGREAFALSTL